MLARRSNLNCEVEEEDGNQQNDRSPHDTQIQSREDRVTLQRRTLIVAVTVNVVIILALLGGVVITAARLIEVTDQLKTGVPDVSKEFPSLSRKEGIVPDEADLTLNPQSAHYLLKVSSDGKSLSQASLSSPPRVQTAETYLRCICVSSQNLLNTRAYFELKVTQSVPWTLGLRTESFNADSTPDTDPEGGIWTIASANGKIIINDGKATQTAYITPAKLGLYLDYARGQVSFYDSVAKRHLHTYLTTFNENLRFYAAVRVGLEETQELFISFV